MNAYYKSIDGLRAIAILGVIFYHCGLATVSGGYTGVDVFFVISGYLIVSSIVRRLEKDEFSLKQYMERRFRRIVPVVVIMLLVVSVASFFILLPEDLDFYGSSLVGVSLFIPNFLFEKEFNYFTSSGSPLIHLWSIGVEVQFYVGVFLFFVILCKIKKIDKSILIISLISLGSFGASVLLIGKHLNPVFYLTPFRLWEFGLGALVSLGLVPSIRHKISDNVLSVTGLLLVLAPMFIYDTTWLFPGYSALPSCLGTAMLLYCVDSDAVVINFLRNSVFSWVGKTSYSTYIWHWPIILFYEYSLNRSLIASDVITLLVLIFSIGWLSWWFVENPFYKKKIISNSRILWGGSFCCLLLFLVAGSVFTHFKGFPDRLPGEALTVLEQSEYRIPTTCPDFGYDIIHRSLTDTYCIIGDQDVAPTWALWGDSHARSLSGPLSQSLKENKASALLLGLHGCPALLNVNVTFYLSGTCKIHNQHAFDRLANNPEIKHVVILSRYSMYLYGTSTGGFDGQRAMIHLMDANGRRLSERERVELFRKSYEETMEKVVSLGKDVHIIMPIPEAPFYIPGVVAQSIWKGDSKNAVKISEDSYQDMNEAVLSAMYQVEKKHPGKIKWINPKDIYCDDGACEVMRDGYILYKDSNHPNAFSANILLESIDLEMKAQN
ncbi:acyltransferase family protein [Thalassospira xiamenensis]|uniref:acyltransferase family protein n=1 Tax=Thalassospira xiamenensis TaxID=220697 RepID=UPI003AA936A6